MSEITEKDVMEATYQLPEAPASVNVKVWIDDYGVMLTMRGQKVSDIVKQLEYIIDTAKKKGWKPTWDKGEQPKATPKGHIRNPPQTPMHHFAPHITAQCGSLMVGMVSSGNAPPKLGMMNGVMKNNQLRSSYGKENTFHNHYVG